MKRSGFAKKEYTRPPRSALQPIAPELAARIHSGPVAASAPIPKTEAQRNPRLLAMARGMPCLLMLDCCNHDSATVVAAHSNQAKHGKAGARKADDQNSVWACSACHQFIDQGPAPKAEKFAAWDEAHERQAHAWELLAASTGTPEADRRAATWALERIHA